MPASAKAAYEYQPPGHLGCLNAHSLILPAPLPSLRKTWFPCLRNSDTAIRRLRLHATYRTRRHLVELRYATAQCSDL